MRFLLVLSLFIIESSFSILGAQTFSQKLTTKTKGTVVLHQDQRLTNIIDGTAATSSSVSNDDNDTTPLAQTGKKTKVRGWRIQVFMGGSQRKDETKAKEAGNVITRHFSELESYVSFESPHWRCRVGDFTTREKAEEYRAKFREAGIGSESIIVKSEIFINQ